MLSQPQPQPPLPSAGTGARQSGKSLRRLLFALVGFVVVLLVASVLSSTRLWDRTMDTGGSPLRLEQPRVAIVFLCDSPANETLSFAGDIVTYYANRRRRQQPSDPSAAFIDVFLVADNSTWQPESMRQPHVVPVGRSDWSPGSAIGLLQYDMQTLVAANFTGLNVAVHNKRRSKAKHEGTVYKRGPTVGSWEKAMYAVLRDPALVDYGLLWFAEQDVFIPSPEALDLLTAKALWSNADYVSAPLSAYQPHLPWGFWNEFEGNRYPRPWYRGMVSFVGLGRPYLNVLEAYRSRHGKFLFLESLLPTLAVVVNTTRILQPLEMTTISYTSHDTVTIDDVVRYPNNIYHPIRKLSTHEAFREALGRNPVPVWKLPRSATLTRRSATRTPRSTPLP